MDLIKRILKYGKVSFYTFMGIATATIGGYSSSPAEFQPAITTETVRKRDDEDDGLEIKILSPQDVIKEKQLEVLDLIGEGLRDRFDPRSQSMLLEEFMERYGHYADELQQGITRIKEGHEEVVLLKGGFGSKVVAKVNSDVIKIAAERVMENEDKAYKVLNWTDLRKIIPKYVGAGLKGDIGIIVTKFFKGEETSPIKIEGGDYCGAIKRFTREQRAILIRNNIDIMAVFHSEYKDNIHNEARIVGVETHEYIVDDENIPYRHRRVSLGKEIRSNSINALDLTKRIDEAVAKLVSKEYDPPKSEVLGEYDSHEGQVSPMEEERINRALLELMIDPEKMQVSDRETSTDNQATDSGELDKSPKYRISSLYDGIIGRVDALKKSYSTDMRPNSNSNPDMSLCNSPGYLNKDSDIESTRLDKDKMDYLIALKKRVSSIIDRLSDDIIHGDWKPENTEWSMLYDFGDVRIGSPLEDIMRFLTSTHIRCSLDESRGYVDRYIEFRSEMDREFKDDKAKHFILKYFSDDFYKFELALHFQRSNKRDLSDPQYAEERQYYFKALSDLL